MKNPTMHVTIFSYQMGRAMARGPSEGKVTQIVPVEGQETWDVETYELDIGTLAFSSDRLANSPLGLFTGSLLLPTPAEMLEAEIACNAAKTIGHQFRMGHICGKRDVLAVKEPRLYRYMDSYEFRWPNIFQQGYVHGWGEPQAGWSGKDVIFFYPSLHGGPFLEITKTDELLIYLPIINPEPSQKGVIGEQAQKTASS